MKNEMKNKVWLKTKLCSLKSSAVNNKKLYELLC